MASNFEEQIQKNLQELDKLSESDPTINDYKQDLNQLNKDTVTKKDRLALAEMLEGIVQGVGNIAAGAIGDARGIGVDPLKLKQTDWAGKRMEADREKQLGMSDVMSRIAADKEQRDSKKADIKTKLGLAESGVNRDWKTEQNRLDREARLALLNSKEGSKQSPQDKFKEKQLLNLKKNKDKLFSELAELKDKGNRDLFMDKLANNLSMDLNIPRESVKKKLESMTEYLTGKDTEMNNMLNMAEQAYNKSISKLEQEQEPQLKQQEESINVAPEDKKQVVDLLKLPEDKRQNLINAAVNTLKNDPKNETALKVLATLKHTKSVSPEKKTELDAVINRAGDLASKINSSIGNIISSFSKKL